MFRVTRTKAGVTDFALYDLEGEGPTDRWLAARIQRCAVTTT
ncbi:hypothetical protein PFI31113_02593 [Pandoraea fibrosis]|uniref:Uncharacterized protein n=1 Tax=Pandoraea fibrosis TaxID=1891094 RepID=A0A5E4VEP7_9BURK|nr:hypothetical protein PFI31113_02593 [Pandoraea fibrosis]